MNGKTGRPDNQTPISHLAKVSATKVETGKTVTVSDFTLRFLCFLQVCNQLEPLKIT